jgi:hypothetical protein
MSLCKDAGDITFFQPEKGGIIMRRVETCPQCGQPLKEVFCWYIRFNGVIYHPENNGQFHFWICGDVKTDLEMLIDPS